MSWNDIRSLQSSSISPAQVKQALERLARELERRFAESISSDSMDFFLAAAKTLSSLRGNGHASLRLRCIDRCGHYFHFNDRFHESMECADEMERALTPKERHQWGWRVPAMRALNQAELGHIADAIVSYCRALELLGDRDPDRKARILLNLGTALNYASLHHDAIHSFAQATRLTNAWLVVSRARSNTALSHLYLGEYESGFACIRPLLDNPEHPGEEQENLRLPMMHSIALRLAVEMGDAQLARGIMEACVSYARASGAGRSVSIGHFAVGLFESRFGNVTHGIDVLERFVSSSAGEGSSYHAMGMSYLVRAYERAGLYDHALDLMRRLHSHTRQVRMKVLAMTPFYGQSPEEIRDLAAMQILESRLQAKASQQRADESRIEMFERLAVTADLKEEASGEHGYRVGRLSSLMAEELGWTKEACRAIDMAARLHDIGKIAMPDRILLTSEQLKEAERHIMSTHTLVGAELLAKSNIPQLQMAEEIAKFHHEWWNGEGYPAKRKEKRIPVHARIVALADVFDALTHGRPFAQPWPIDKALDEIRSRRGTQFDPELTDLFLELVARLRTEHENLDEYLGKAGRNSPFLQAREKIRLMLADPPTANSPKNASETVH